MELHTLSTSGVGPRPGLGQRTPGRGLRAFTPQAAAACRLTDEFRGLDAGVTKSMVLGALKRVGSYAAIPLMVQALVDLLFKYSRDVDWQSGQMPVVWPSNEELAREMRVTVRQLQNLLNEAQALGLISFKDSPNGKRGGCRRADGVIVWAYGIVLAPIGTRYREFSERAKLGEAEEARLTHLKKRLASARRTIRSLTQAAEDNGFAEREAWEAMDIVLLAVSQMKNVRDLGLYGACVEQIEERSRQLAELLEAGFKASNEATDTADISCWDEADCAHSKATNELPTAKAVTCSGSAGRSSGSRGGDSPLTPVEDETTKHGIGLDFVTELANELDPALPLTKVPSSWGEVVAVAEKLSHRAGISTHAFHEAVRIMGDRDAAASVIVTLHKYHRGDVQRPGAYLRGMSKKAMGGALRLGPTLHGLRDADRSNAMKRMPETATLSIGTMLPGILKKAGYRR